MYVRGVTGKNDMPLTDLWNKNWGIVFCKQVMSRDRFDILRFLRFAKNLVDQKDYKLTNLLCFQQYGIDLLKFVLHSTGAFLSVDEQLFSIIAGCPFTQFMAS